MYVHVSMDMCTFGYMFVYVPCVHLVARSWARALLMKGHSSCRRKRQLINLLSRGQITISKTDMPFKTSRVFLWENKEPTNLSYGKKFNKIIWKTFWRYRGFLVKFPISYSVKDLIFQNLVIFGNFWNGLLLLTLCTRISAVSKAFSAT